MKRILLFMMLLLVTGILLIGVSIRKIYNDIFVMRSMKKKEILPTVTIK